ncbi:patatin [Hydrogenophaga crassostreae]|uniref:Patatin n=1 Tax=Hydrogenophaga crassostreae TaxID=1763535 RepID=A0A162P291_9BURK|nr:patatin-like phospholipase family protein [Hydrogenophaga crassostreae]AOW12532.1 patatin [Hydrogenophaga crassostreae]OAD40400.1 patatin [Hydrogenophaga crassostreae]
MSASPKPTRTTSASKPTKRHIDLALQGGGSHGAFTWGVLDRLLEEEWLEIAGISGTSAGAMNAVALAAGLMEGGREGARACLRRFWQSVAESSPFHHLESNPVGALLGPGNPWMQALMAPFQQYAQFVGSQLSPYQLNPLNLNPLRKILEDTVDFERVRHCDRTHLFIAATHVATGELRIFRQDQLTADMVLASACLPLMFQAVEVNGEAYWDGGYAGNPALMPLISETDADDLLLVQINPSHRGDLPTSAADILDRASEVTFNASLLKELRTIGLLKEVLREANRPDSAYSRPLFKRVDDLRLHRLDADDELSQFNASSKTQTGWAFLEQLHDLGRKAANNWLKENSKHLGKRSTYALPDALTR